MMKGQDWARGCSQGDKQRTIISMLISNQKKSGKKVGKKKKEKDLTSDR